MNYKIDRDISTSIEQINFVHSLIQELESSGVVLPMGDYSLVYDYIEGARDILAEYEEAVERATARTRDAIGEISQIIYENYYTLGVTGSQAMQNIQEDIDAGFFEETVDGWDITYDELGLAVDAVRDRLESGNAMTKEQEFGAPTNGWPMFGDGLLNWRIRTPGQGNK